MERDAPVLAQRQGDRDRLLREHREHERASRETFAAPAPQTEAEQAGLRRQAITRAVWETLEVTNPEGIERETLEEVAASVGVSLDVLLSEDGELVPDLAPLAGDGLEPADRRAQSPDQIARQVGDGGDRTGLALLSTPPTTGRTGATSLSETVRSALHNIGANRTRGLLTMLGIIIGVLSVVVLQSIGNGFQGYVDDVTGQYGGNNVIIQPARLIVNGIDSGALQRSLSLDDAKALAQPGATPDAMAVSPTVSGHGLLHAGSANVATTAVGVWPDYLTVGGYKLTSGSFVSTEDVNNRALVIDLGANPAKKLFGSENPLGQTVWLNDTALRVIGVMAATNPQIGGGDDSVYIPLSTALDRVLGGQASSSDGSKAVDSITVRANSSSTIAAAQDEATALLAERHGANGSPDFVASSLLSALQQRQQILTAMNAFMIVVAGISLLVGGIGIMNIMLVSVSERTREIGLRKAIGARSRDILNQFLVESMLISLVGAGIGVGLAGLIVLLVSALWRPSPPSPIGIASAVFAAVATGLFFGVSPARRASALQPIEALRGE
jgi:putative ABC transport system permease protein